MVSSSLQEEPLTRWTVLSATQIGSRQENLLAVEELCSRFWPAIYSYFRRHNETRADASDFTAGFCAHLAEGNFLRYACRDYFCFRTFVLASLEHFCNDPWQKGQALARKKSTAIPISLSAEQLARLEPSKDNTPTEAFGRRWALTVLELALERLDQAGEATGKRDLYFALRPHLTGMLAPNYPELCGRLGLSETTLKVALHRLRAHFGDLTRAIVRETVRNRDEIESEIHCLKTLLG